MTLPPRGAWLSLALLALAACGGEPQSPNTLDTETQAKMADAQARLKVDANYESDGRILLLLDSCAKGGYYDRDTGDPVSILLDKLQFGSSDALHRAKEELGDMGEHAATEVARLLNRNFDDPMGAAKVQNTIEVLGLMRTPAAHAPLIKSLDHPRDSVRGVTMRALAGGAAWPEDFDRILAHVPVEKARIREQAAIALFVADPDRAAGVFLEWLEAGTNAGLWGFMAAHMADADSKLIAPEAAALCDQVDPRIGLPLAAIGLQTGDPRPRALLDQYLAKADAGQRLPAVSALLQSGYVAELANLAITDPDAVIRQQVLVALAQQADEAGAPSQATLDTFHAGLDDSDPNVRKVSMGTLLGWRDAAAQDRALTMLGGDRTALQEIVLIVIEPLRQQPEFAKRVLDRLLEIEEDHSGRPLKERLGILQAIGQVPTVEAAAYLYDTAQTAEGELQGLRAFRWLTIQVSNTGRAGRLWLASKLKTEVDPARRLDILWAISSQRDATTEEFLTDFLQTDGEPYELLFAADRLAKSGKTATAAPLLKRVTMGVSHPKVRRALECLLWRWY